MTIAYAMSGFPVSPDSAEAQVRSDEKNNASFGSYFLTFLPKNIRIGSCVSKL